MDQSDKVVHLNTSQHNDDRVDSLTSASLATSSLSPMKEPRSAVLQSGYRYSERGSEKLQDLDTRNPPPGRDFQHTPGQMSVR